MRRRKSTFNPWLSFSASCLIIVAFFYFTLINRFTEVFVQPSTWQEFFPKNQTYLGYIVIARALIQDNPAIVGLTLQPNFWWQTLNLSLNLTEPVAKICDPKKCYLLDSYARILELPIKEKLFLIQSKPKIDIGKLNPKLTQLFFAIFSYSNWKPYPIQKALIHENLDVSVFDSAEHEFLFDPNQNISEQIKKWHLILNDPRIKSAQRIDLRIPKKIFLLPKTD